MKKLLVLFCFITNFSQLTLAQEAKNIFEDQLQYELFYEYLYQDNVVEAFLLECTGDRKVSYTYAFAVAGMHNSYKKDILGMENIGDPFSDKDNWKRAWLEIKLAVTRNYDSEIDRAEPVLTAQKDVMRLIETYKEEKDFLCDFVFWEEVLWLENITDELMQDVKVRKADTPELLIFEENSRQALETMARLFNENPLAQ